MNEKPICKDCSDCKHQDEVDGESCYECVKGMADNFEAIKECDTDEK